jgi:hypothetical protein
VDPDALTLGIGVEAKPLQLILERQTGRRLEPDFGRHQRTLADLTVIVKGEGERPAPQALGFASSLDDRGGWGVPLVTRTP